MQHLGAQSNPPPPRRVSQVTCSCWTLPACAASWGWHRAEPIILGPSILC